MYRVLIADSNRRWLDILESRLNAEEGFDVAAKAFDGKEAIALIEKFLPDVIMLDIIMAEFDGVYIVNHIREKMCNYEPIIYIISGMATDSIVKIISDLDVDFYSVKPVKLELVVQSLKMITGKNIARRNVKNLPYGNEKYNVNDARESFVRDTVYKLGMPAHLLSTQCVIDALLFYLQSPDCVRMLTKVLYPKIARERNISVSSVEKDLRNAIAQMQKKRSDFYEQMFSFFEKKKITSGEFLSIVSHYIKTHAHGANEL